MDKVSYRGAPILKIFVKNRVKGFLKVSNPPPPSAVKEKPDQVNFVGVQVC